MPIRKSSPSISATATSRRTTSESRRPSPRRRGFGAGQRDHRPRSRERGHDVPRALPRARDADQPGDPAARREDPLRHRKRPDRARLHRLPGEEGPARRKPGGAAHGGSVSQQSPPGRRGDYGGRGAVGARAHHRRAHQGGGPRASRRGGDRRRGRAEDFQAGPAPGVHVPDPRTRQPRASGPRIRLEAPPPDRRRPPQVRPGTAGGRRRGADRSRRDAGRSARRPAAVRAPGDLARDASPTPTSRAGSTSTGSRSR